MTSKKSKKRGRGRKIETLEKRLQAEDPVEGATEYAPEGGTATELAQDETARDVETANEARSEVEATCAEKGEQRTLFDLRTERALGQMQEGPGEDPIELPIPEDEQLGGDPDGEEGPLRLIPSSPDDRVGLRGPRPAGREAETQRGEEGAPQGESLFARGLRLQRSARFDESEKAYKSLLETEPEHLGALTNLGILAYMHDRFAEALGHFSEVSRLDPSSADGAYNAGMALRGIGRITEAMERFEQAQLLAPEDLMTSYELGRCYLDMDLPEKLLSFIEERRDRFVGVKEIILLKAEALMRMGEFDATIELLKPVLRDDLSSHRAYALVAEAHFHGQRVEKAITSVKRALLVAADVAEYHKRLGIYYAYRGDSALAREEFATARGLDPSIPLQVDGDLGGAVEGAMEHWDRLKFENYILGRSRFYAKTGNWRGAVNEFLILSQKYPGQSIIWQELGAAYQNTKELKRAHKMYERARKIDPANLEVQLQLCRIALELGELVEARRINDETSRCYEQVPEVQLLRGQIRFASGEIDEARKAFVRVIELEPSQVDAMVGLGRCHRSLVREDEALAVFEKAYRIAPGRLDVLQELADLYCRAERWSQARDVLREGKKLHPDSISLHASLGEIYLAQGRIDAARSEYQAITGTSAANWAEAVALAKSMIASRRLKDALRVVKHLLRQSLAEAELHGLEALIHGMSRGEVKFWIPWQRAWREEPEVFDRLLPFVEMVCLERDLAFFRKQMKRTRTLFASFPEIFDRVIAFEEQLGRLGPGEGSPEQSA